MNLTAVIENLVDERGLNKEQVISIVSDGIKAAYSKKYPDLDFTATYNAHSGQVEVFVPKTVVSSVEDEDLEITVRRARTIESKAKLGDVVSVPFDGSVGRIEILTAKQVISNSIRELEQSAIFEEFAEKEGAIVAGMVHKRERDGYSIKVGDTMALLPRENSIPDEAIRVGAPIRALLKEVLPMPRGDYQLILDRASSDFIHRLLELEIPEVYEGIVEIQKIERIAGYKSKLIVSSNSSDVDPVGTCVGVGGARIKPILREIGREKIDLIEETSDLETLVKDSLKPAEIDKVEIHETDEGSRAIVWLAQDQRSYAIGKMGQNINLASRLSGVEVQLQDVVSQDEGLPSFGDDEEEHLQDDHQEMLAQEEPAEDTE